jgi:hypothetical protein
MRARRGRRFEQRFGKLAAQRIACERAGLGHHGFHFLRQTHFVAAPENEMADEIDAAPLGFSERHAETDEIFGVHKRTFRFSAFITFGAARARANHTARRHPAGGMENHQAGRRSAGRPPIFASDDPLGVAPQSVALYEDWTAAKKTAELHFFSKGGHGFGMRTPQLPSDHWMERFADWLEGQGLLTK